MNYTTPSPSYQYTIPVFNHDCTRYISYSTTITSLTDTYFIVNIVHTRVFSEMVRLREEICIE